MIESIKSIFHSVQSDPLAPVAGLSLVFITAALAVHRILSWWDERRELAEAEVKVSKSTFNGIETSIAMVLLFLSGLILASDAVFDGVAISALAAETVVD